MDQHKKSVLVKRIHKVMENLEQNNMESFYAETKEDAVKKVAELMHEGDTVSVGGSMTLFECGVIDLIRSGRYNFLDRYRKGLTAEEMRKIYIGAFTSDVYLTSCNAVTENGELYNVDGNSNRVAAILYGPEKVIVVAGYNKIVKDIDEAVIRVKKTAAPANSTRLGCKTYCAEKGECMAFETGDAGMAAGCKSPGRICCNYVVSAMQRHKGRIYVIIVGEELGY